MADRKSINLQINLQGKAEARKELNKVIDELNKSGKITPNIKLDETSLNNFKNALAKIMSETNLFKFNENGEKELNKVITTINTGLGQTLKLTQRIKDGKPVGDVLGVDTTNYDKQEKELEKLQQRIQTMQSKMGTKGGTNGLVNNNLIDESVITNIQNRLNAINTKTPREEIEALENEIKNLGSSEPQIVRVQNAINSMKTGLEGMKGKYGSLVGDSKSIGQLTAYENKIKDLEGVLQQLQSGKNFDGSIVSQHLNEATNASRSLTNAVRNSSSALKLNQQDALSFGDSLKRALSVTGIYTGVYQAVMMLKTAIRDAVEYVKYLDESLKYVDELM